MTLVEGVKAHKSLWKITSLLAHKVSPDGPERIAGLDRIADASDLFTGVVKSMKRRRCRRFYGASLMRYGRDDHIELRLHNLGQCIEILAQIH